MGDVIQFPTPHAPPANDTTVVWQGCWHCGLILFDDETELCTPCRTLIEHQPPPPKPRWMWHDTTGHWLFSNGIRPSFEYMRGTTRPETIARMASTIIETGINQAETAAQQWAADHLDTPAERHAYIGDVRGRCERNLALLCHTDAQKLGERIGWR